jgi:hypothetical protein
MGNSHNNNNSNTSGSTGAAGATIAADTTAQAETTASLLLMQGSNTRPNYLFQQQQQSLLAPASSISQTSSPNTSHRTALLAHSQSQSASTKRKAKSKDNLLNTSFGNIFAAHIAQQQQQQQQQPILIQPHNHHQNYQQQQPQHHHHQQNDAIISLLPLSGNTEASKCMNCGATTSPLGTSTTSFNQSNQSSQQQQQQHSSSTFVPLSQPLPNSVQIAAIPVPVSICMSTPLVEKKKWQSKGILFYFLRFLHCFCIIVADYSIDSI